MDMWSLKFNGELIEGFLRDEVKSNLKQIMSQKEIDYLFNSKEIIIKRNIPKDIAKKQILAFRKLGLIIHPVFQNTTKTSIPNNDKPIKLKEDCQINNSSKNTHFEDEKINDPFAYLDSLGLELVKNNDSKEEITQKKEKPEERTSEIIVDRIIIIPSKVRKVKKLSNKEIIITVISTLIILILLFKYL